MIESLNAERRRHHTVICRPGRLRQHPKPEAPKVAWFVTASHSARQGAPYKESSGVGHAPARRIYELQAFFLNYTAWIANVAVHAPHRRRLFHHRRCSKGQAPRFEARVRRLRPPRRSLFAGNRDPRNHDVADTKAMIESSRLNDGARKTSNDDQSPDDGENFTIAAASSSVSHPMHAGVAPTGRKGIERTPTTSHTFIVRSPPTPIGEGIHRCSGPIRRQRPETDIAME